MVGEGWGDGGWGTEWEEQVVDFLLEKQTVGYGLDDGWLAYA